MGAGRVAIHMAALPRLRMTSMTSRGVEDGILHAISRVPHECEALPKGDWPGSSWGSPKKWWLDWEAAAARIPTVHRDGRLIHGRKRLGQQRYQLGGIQPCTSSRAVAHAAHRADPSLE